ncbi:hypothetical protein [Arcanobacterium phocae]|uniref:hypothetical protein n=1 Tax=Arcanobacterium phocae TaxID=131112 RepID=UPI001C0F2C81|nr:hypothetical protein [Arcanobacterium phocae]
MTTPNDPYNSATPRPFDDDDILDPITENPERSLPDAAPEQVGADMVVTDDAPDFGELAPIPQPQTTAEPHYSANEFALDEPYSTMPDPDLPAASSTTQVNPNPTLGNFLGEPVATPIPSAPAETSAPEPVSPTRTSVMEGSDGEPTFADTHDDWGTDPGDLDPIPDEPKGRGWLHVGGFFLTILLLPVAWYFISDAGARLYLVDNNPWETKSFALFPFVELIGGLAVITLIWLTARATSLGAQFWGAVITLCGLAALITPSSAQRAITWLDNQIGSYNAFTGNVIHHIELDFGTGRVAILGFMLFMTGIVAHAARRRGQVYATAVTRRELMLPAESAESTENN